MAKRRVSNTKNFSRTASKLHRTNKYMPVRGGIRL